MERSILADIQNQTDDRNIKIDWVGIKNLYYPIKIPQKNNFFQNTVAEIEMAVELQKNIRGTHMSRFIEVLERSNNLVNYQNIFEILRAIAKRLNSQKAYIKFSFPFFIEKKAPVSEFKSLLKYDCKLYAQLIDNETDLVFQISVPVTTLCPCSKALSKYSAHNQRSIVTVNVRFQQEIWIEDIICLIESSASCDIYTLLKRSDEKYVTEKAYNRPRFVEDLVREIAQNFEKLEHIIWYTINVESIESIHSHNAFAFIKRDKNTS